MSVLNRASNTVGIRLLKSASRPGSLAPQSLVCRIQTPVSCVSSFHRYFSQASLAFAQPSSSTSLQDATPSASSGKLVNHSSGGSSAMNLDINSFDFLPEVKSTLQKRFGISQLYPIQGEVFEPVRSGRDLIGRSRTGTGKTLAFCLPLVEKLLRSGTRVRPGHCSVVILEPTRELANQVSAEIQKLVRGALSVCTVYGGVSYTPQEQQLRAGVDILIATPGRLIDHMERRNINLGATSACVLDEADEMLRMGFVEPVEQILGDMPQSKQLLLFSATMPSWVSSIARKHCTDPLIVDKVTGTEGQTSLTVAHKAICAPRDLRARGALINGLLHQYATGVSGRAIVFTRTKADADQLAGFITEMGARARAIHGDVVQSRREMVMADFRNGRFRVLVATDVAARGLDIPDVELVVQSWFPDEIEPYIHRSGRTGRAGKSGVCVVMYEPAERARIAELSNFLKVPVEAIYPPQSAHHNRDRLMERMDHMIQKNKRKVDQFMRFAEDLNAKYGKEAIAALLSENFGAEMAPRSLLTSMEGYTTVIVSKQGVGNGMFDAASRLAAILGLDETFDPSSIEYFSGGAVCDIQSSLAERLITKLEEDSTITDVQIATQLPGELFRPRTYGGFRPSSQYRGRGGSRSSGEFGGSREYRYGQGRGGNSGGYRRPSGSDSDRTDRPRYGSGSRQGFGSTFREY